MTVHEIEERVRRIEVLAGDDEAAHVAEDHLWQDVLGAIVTGRAEDPVRCAAAALKTQAVRFTRWAA